MYNGLTDILQVSNSQWPISAINLFEKIEKALVSFSDNQKLSIKILDFQEKAEKHSMKFLENVRNLAGSKSALRAEFRIPLERFISMASVLDLYFTNEVVQLNSILLETEVLIKLIEFWVQFVMLPIKKALTKIAAHCYSGEMKKVFDDGCLPTVEAFETLYTDTLLSGNFYSDISQIFWRDRKTNPMFDQSLRISKSINELNRPDFSGELWMKTELQVKASIDLLETLFTRKNVAMAKNLTDLYETIIRIRNLETAEEKAEALWNQYFKFLYEKKPCDFVCPFQYGKVFHISGIKSEVLIRKTKIDYNDATKKVFDFSRISKLSEKRSSNWKTPYLMAYLDASKSSKSFKQELDIELVKVAMVLKLEFIHNPGENSSFYDLHKGAPQYIPILKTSDVIEKIMKAHRKVTIRGKRLPQEILFTSPPLNSLAQKIKYSLDEDVALCVALNTFKTSGKRFVLTALCKSFHFWNGSYVGRIRTSQSLQDRYKTLKRKNQIKEDTSTEQLFVEGSTIDQCKGLDVDISELEFVLPNSKDLDYNSNNEAISPTFYNDSYLCKDMDLFDPFINDFDHSNENENGIKLSSESNEMSSSEIESTNNQYEYNSMAVTENDLVLTPHSLEIESFNKKFDEETFLNERCDSECDYNTAETLLALKEDPIIEPLILIGRNDPEVIVNLR